MISLLQKKKLKEAFEDRLMNLENIFGQFVH